MFALSIVSPHGTNIAEGRKTIEVRSWRPPYVPMSNILIVENHKFLTEAEPEDEHGLAVALADIVEVHDWLPQEVDAACSSGWQPGYKAWILQNVRPILPKVKLPAKRKLYEVEFSLPAQSGA
jgi:hypothetical protein